MGLFCKVIQMSKCNFIVFLFTVKILIACCSIEKNLRVKMCVFVQ